MTETKSYTEFYECKEFRLEYMDLNYCLHNSSLKLMTTEMFHTGDFKSLPIEQRALKTRATSKRISEIEKTVLKEASTNII